MNLTNKLLIAFFIFFSLAVFVFCFLFLNIEKSEQSSFSSEVEAVKINFLTHYQTIDIKQGVPISDEIGKTNEKENEYIDFTVTGSAINDLKYDLLLKKDVTSDLEDKDIKIYLTTFENDKEVPVSSTLSSGKIITYSELEDSNTELHQKIVYSGAIKAGEIAYGKKFRLRAWIADDHNVNKEPYSNKQLKLDLNLIYSEY